MFLFKNKRSFSTVELMVVMCIIFILIGTFAIYAHITLKRAREVALQNELSNIRMSIEHYRIINGKFPEDLCTLINKRLTTKVSANIIAPEQFLKPFRVDKDGYLLDPFMQRYIYNKSEGRVYSQTKGHERW